MKFAWHPTGILEAGIDGYIELLDPASGQALKSAIGVQSKATKVALANETSQGFDYYCEERDIDYWLRGNLPVLLIVSRPVEGLAYWKNFKEYFANRTV